MGISHRDEGPELAVVEVCPGERSKAVRASVVVLHVSAVGKVKAVAQ